MKRLVVFACGLLAGAALMLAWPLRAHDLESFKKAAPGNNPLFINMTTGDSWRGWMGLHFAHDDAEDGSPGRGVPQPRCGEARRANGRAGEAADRCSAFRARSSPISSRTAALC